MKNYNYLFCLATLFVSCADASSYGITCTKPQLSHVTLESTPTPFTFTCTNGTKAAFDTVNFNPHSLSQTSTTSTIVIPTISMAAGETKQVDGLLITTAANHYVFDFDLNYGGANHEGVLCKNDPTSAACMAVDVENPSFLAIADIHYKKGGPVTDYGKGDTGDTLWSNTKNELAQLITTNKPKFVLVLGDLPAHHDDPDLVENLRAVLGDLSAMITQTPVYYVFGNNDGLGGDYHSFTDNTGNTPFSTDPGKSWPTLNVQHSCASYSSEVPCNLDTTTGARFGYYSARPVLGTRLIVLNSVIFTARYVSDDGITQEQATEDELTWFDQQLDAARNAQDNVIIAMHVPAGLDGFSGGTMWKDPATQSHFMNSVANHSTIIRAIVSAHTHMDELRRLYDSQGKLAALDISVPGITPLHNNNAAIKQFFYGRSDFNVKDIFTYYTTPTQSDVWKSYSFQKDYSCTTENVTDCAKGFSRTDAAFTNQYDLDYYVRRTDFPSSSYDWQGVWKAIDLYPASA